MFGQVRPIELSYVSGLRRASLSHQTVSTIVCPRGQRSNGSFANHQGAAAGKVLYATLRPWLETPRHN